MVLYVELLNSINAAPHIGPAPSKWTHSMLLIMNLIDFQHCHFNQRTHKESRSQADSALDISRDYDGDSLSGVSVERGVDRKEAQV